MNSLSQVKSPNKFLCQKFILRVFLPGFESLTTKSNKLKRTDTKKIIVEWKWSDLKQNKLILNTIDLNNIPQILQHAFKYSSIEKWPFNKYLCPSSIKPERIYLKITANNLIYSIDLFCNRLASPQNYKILPTRTMSCSSFAFSSVLGTY